MSTGTLCYEMVNNNLDGIIYYEAIRDENNLIIDYKYKFLNEICFKVLKRSREEFLNSTFKQINPGADTAPLFTMLTKVVETGELTDNDFYHQKVDRWFNYRAIKYNDGVFVYVRDITKKKIMEMELAKSLHEKDMIIKESHHRIKNNLQLLASLIHLKTAMNGDGNIVGALNEVEAHLNIIGLVHDKLFTVDSYEKIDLPAYITSLINIVSSISGVDRNLIAINTEFDRLYCSPKFAINIGLFINELVSNCLKYAFPDKRKGIINICIKDNGDSIFILVEDDGCGIKEEISDNPATLGFQLLYSLAEQTDGKIEIKSDNGTKVSLLVKKIPDL